MLPNFLQLFGRQPDDDYERAFVQDVAVREQPQRSRRVERLIYLGWLLIAAKSVLVWWACMKYHVPIHPLWIVAPTVMFGLLCTAVYFGRR
jgi:hypothetical protein